MERPKSYDIILETDPDNSIKPGGRRRCTGADPGFQVREAYLKIFAPSGGRRENVWGIAYAPGAPPPPPPP